MFEASLVGLQKKGAGRKWLSLPLAVALHLVILSSVVFAQYWNVDQVPEPQTNDVFSVALPPPPPPIAQRGTVTPPTVHHATTPAAVPDRPAQPTQPAAPSELPVPPAAAADDPQPGVPDGADHGVLNGDPLGSPLGVPGGVPHSIAIEPPHHEEAIPFRGDMTRPQIVYRVPPQYTEIARHARLQGSVIVQAVIDESGRVLDVQVLKHLPMGLDRAAADAVAQWRFTPATLNGRPLKVIYTLTVNFTVQ